ncbi:MAG: two-component sensor histidine kinase [Bacteroidetes bacterium]|nr:two-component sensor histidine kinase [Bacteroidota bacterium]MCB8930367.1 two-component sensor histidine kinase [Bacteroidia bacterium]MCE7954066.1 two-component sensor histidine kinase [Bacteroidetes bacterium CHB6]MCW5932167.1 two-component sensor histidine kinase [Bacteroidota bacterium]
MKLSFRQRLFIYFAVLFTVFTVGIAIIEQSQEKDYKTEALKEKLDVYTNIIQAAISGNSLKPEIAVASVKQMLPSDLRITLIDAKGNVQYDNMVDDYSQMDNHLNREEIQLALQNGTGSYIRESESTHQPYLYYAKKTGDTYIRVALQYNIQLQRFLKADNLFLYLLIALFAISLWVIHRITKQFGTSIQQLRDFALQPSAHSTNFSSDELGEIGKKISENYQQAEEGKKNLQLEKQKLLQHISISEEGICFISAAHQVEFHNGLFMHHLNQITDTPQSNPAVILQDEIFSSLHQFLSSPQENYFETQIKKQGKIFSLRASVFEDRSFEVILTDITQHEKTKQLKQEMTGNIAHELRTPITSIRAYLETILEQSLPEDKQQHFITQAYQQTLTLSEMIKDMGLLAKMEEAPNTFALENVKLIPLLEQLKTDVGDSLKQKNIQWHWQLPDNITIRGNASLLNSIFRNLIENSIRYAGESIEINLSVFNEDPEFYYFSFYDTGMGIPNESQLNRLFERFYRVQEGRTRDTGGSGLGLSIVKNAIQFHRGSITAKNRTNGGLEFIFTLHK